MLHSQRLHTSLAISAICHLVLILLVVKFVVIQPVELVATRIKVDIFRFSPKVYELPKLVKPISLPSVSQVELPKQKHEISKPSLPSSLDWTKINQVEESHRLKAGIKSIESRPSITNGRVLHGSMSHINPIKSSPKEVPKLRPGVRLIRRSSDDGNIVLRRVTPSRIPLEGEDSLAENSPNLDLKQAQKKRRRGQALRFASIANSSGVGGMTSPPSNYPKMMSDLARRQLLTVSGSKVDVIFVIDKTGSMVDNVRGVRAYIDHFFDLYDREGYDIAVGLVTFADLENHKIKWHGVTDNRRKFKKWLQKIDFEGGGDLTESGLDALMKAIYKIKYRELTQRIFVMVSDGVFHDADYNGRSEYSQDQVIASLKEYSIRVDVIGVDYLPVRQLADATGGSWQAIPGKGYMERQLPFLTEKMLSEFGAVISDAQSYEDELVVWLSQAPRPKSVKISWKVLNPVGERCYGVFTKRVMIPDDDSVFIKFSPRINLQSFKKESGIYTVIYRLENDLGHRSILRRNLEL
ncbi:hypothetical protein CMK22_07430 [Candidatus Poribacteria bacterium]|nr:hypothetical protein [Candidatus Poribacteria bacterium]